MTNTRDKGVILYLYLIFYAITSAYNNLLGIVKDVLKSILMSHYIFIILFFGPHTVVLRALYFLVFSGPVFIYYLWWGLLDHIGSADKIWVDLSKASVLPISPAPQISLCIVFSNHLLLRKRF